MLNARLAAALRTATSECKSDAIRMPVRVCLGDSDDWATSVSSSVRAIATFANAFDNILKEVNETGFGKPDAELLIETIICKIGFAPPLTLEVTHHDDIALSTNPSRQRSMSGKS